MLKAECTKSTAFLMDSLCSQEVKISDSELIRTCYIEKDIERKDWNRVHKINSIFDGFSLLPKMIFSDSEVIRPSCKEKVIGGNDWNRVHKINSIFDGFRLLPKMKISASDVITTSNGRGGGPMF